MKIKDESYYESDNTVSITVKNKPHLVAALLEVFGWIFKPGLKCPVMTGNCEDTPNHGTPHCEGTLEDGYYRNAADVCRYCYFAGNPARLEWDEESITLTTIQQSSKYLKLLDEYSFHCIEEEQLGYPLEGVNAVLSSAVAKLDDDLDHFYK